jgi:hypothetical protein
VFARRFSAAGVAQATEFQVNSYNTSYQSSAAVAMESGGDFVVVWTSDFQDGFGSGIFARRFSSAGVSVAAEFQVNSYTSSSQHLLALAIDADGDFVVAWNSYGQDGYGGGVFSKLFTAAGIPVTADFQVSLQTANKQFRTAVTLDGDGDFVVAWDGYDGPFNFGIFAQRFATLLALEIDGDGSIGALTDGLLVLRYLFGFTGSALAVGAVSGGCTRCSPTEIKDYLDSIASELDVDGNGSAAALTDGLLILRYLFGFTGATLVSDAIDVVGCSRCDPTAIESYLQTQL